ncbi:hypothetical protein RYZ26_19390 [Terasakiella sp. A23]|uniref:hypothetical protein n=1 Tax=Terasakiella sp. FCG-A23 TaxID=3080561 RepID=UPI0029530BD0|nr:hypothetical protein [Terasakiella sp. A23]MDV7341774.1 hypothetical protein [Terasakiella sp. A23]
MSESIVIGNLRPWTQETGDAIQTEFIYLFPIFKEGDLEVYLDDALQTTGYSVAGAGQSAGGSVTFDTPPQAGVVVTLRRRLVIERTSDFAEGGAFHAHVINQELDYLVAVAQQNADDLNRSVLLNPTDADAALVLPSKEDRTDKTLAFDGNGSPIAGPGSDEIAAAQANAETATQAAIDASAAQAAAEAAAELADSFNPNLYRAIADQIVTADVADGAITQVKIDPTVALGGPSLGADSIIRTNGDTISENITIPTGTNGVSVGPITIADGYTLTVNGNYTVV